MEIRRPQSISGKEKSRPRTIQPQSYKQDIISSRQQMFSIMGLFYAKLNHGCKEGLIGRSGVERRIRGGNYF